MRDYKARLIRINDIAGMLYRSKKVSQNLVIYGLGAPVVPDSGNLPDAPIIMQLDVDLFVPDYIGYGRSDGICTPLNCIKTFLNLYKWFTKGCVVINEYERLKLKLKYGRIIFMGRSFGGTYIPLLPKFNPEIKELCLIYPAVDNKSCGSIPGEESNEDFMRAMRFDGYHHLYRGILSKKWQEHLEGRDGISPMDNIGYLTNTRLFIGHGKKDKCIHYSKSVTYFQKIIGQFPATKDQFKLKLYPNVGHNLATSNQAVKDCLEWFGLNLA